MGMRNAVENFVLVNRFKRIAEIGVKKGRLSERLARLPNVKVVYSVDPWDELWFNFELRKKARSSDSKADYPDVAQSTLDEVYYSVVTRMPENVKVLRMTSERAAKVIPDNSLDFVFLDALHTYEALKNDIQWWLPKIQIGGVLAGDDYHDDFPGVIKAVDEFGGCSHIGAGRYPKRIWWKRV